MMKEHTHEWVVFSTALAERWLMVQCVDCGQHGTVDDPDDAEWSTAFHAPSKPYRWLDDSRVTVRRKGPLYVAKSDSGSTTYERIPRELMGTTLPVTVEEKEELEALAEIAVEGQLCGELFPLYIRSFQQDTGREPSAAVKRFVQRCEMWSAKGLSAPPEMVASALKWYVREASSGRMDESQSGSPRMDVKLPPHISAAVHEGRKK